MQPETTVLLVTAASIAGLHTLVGPDHYLPFLAMARVREWSLGRTLAITLACGAGHVLSSVALGAVGILFGWALGVVVWLERTRGAAAAWLLLGFGLAYTAWGLRRALRGRPHTHWHGHANGTVHEHEHAHRAEHAHLHEAPGGRPRSLTPWVLFTLFVLGPCEPLIPLLMYPAAERSWSSVTAVSLVFGISTLATMAAVVTIAYQGLARLPLGPLERYSHVLAGLALVACALAIQLGL